MILAQVKKFTVLMIFMGLSFYWAGASADELPPVNIKEGLNLAADGVEANKKQIPVLMFFSIKHCAYCIEVEEDFLKPILRNSEYDNKVIIRKMKIDSNGDLIDFAGKEQDVEDFSDVYNVSMVPSLIFVDSQGNELVAPIVGIRNAHYYSADLDIAIKSSTQKIRAIVKR